MSDTCQYPDLVEIAGARINYNSGGRADWAGEANGAQKRVKGCLKCIEDIIEYINPVDQPQKAQEMHRWLWSHGSRNSQSESR